MKPVLPVLARQLPRFGYRRMAQTVRETLEPIGEESLRRLWRLLGLQVKPRTRVRQRRRAGEIVVGLRATSPNQVWCLDFVKDRTRDQRSFRVLSVVDEYTRECLALVVGRQFLATDVVRALNRVLLTCGTPGYLRSDNGPEFIATEVALWAREQGIQLVHTRPASPWENAFSETFHSRLRDEFMERELFGSLVEAEVLCERYRWWYNLARPHSALQYRTPAAFAAQAMRSALGEPGLIGVQA